MRNISSRQKLLIKDKGLDKHELTNVDFNGKILVVDDVTNMRKMIVHSLKQMGFVDIVEAADGSSAWELLRNSKDRIGLIVSDWDMPKVDGMELLDKVRKDAKLMRTPFLLVGSASDHQTVTSVIRAGVSNYMVKPFSPDTLIKKVVAIHSKLNDK